MIERTKLRLLAGAALLAMAAPAYAQGDTDVDDVITVTVQKRAQTLQEIPQSVSVVGGETLERLNASSYEDYLALIPGLAVNSTTPGVNRVILRGLDAGGVAATISTYVDETPFGSSSGLVNAAILNGNFDTFDIERIEVLRGPQGTLYGANSMGGVFKFVTKEPSTDAFAARARVGVESTKNGEIGYSGAGVVNVPLGDLLAFRASGFYRKTGGYADSIGADISGVLPAGAFGPGLPAADTPFSFVSDTAEDTNSSESYGGRASLLFTPTDNFSLRGTVLLQNLDTESASSVEIDPATREPVVGPDGGFVRSRFADPTNTIAYRLYNGTAEWDLGFGSLVSSTSYSTFDQTIHADVTTLSVGVPLALLIDVFLGSGPTELVQDQETDQRKFTQELRLSSADNDRFEWLVGFYYTNEDGLIRQIFNGQIPGTLMINPAVPLLADLAIDSTYKEYAGFANATVYLGDRFDLTFGGRYSHNSQVANQDVTGLPGLLIAGPASFTDLRSDENVFTWSVAPRFEISDHVSAYARFAKGYRPGGPNILPPDAPPGTPLTYEADTVISYEAGIKAGTPDGVFAIDLAAFYLDWNGIQLLTTINDFNINANGGSAFSAGFEFSASLQPMDGLSFLLNGAYTKAELTEDAPLAGGADGDPLPVTPEFSIGLNGDYEWALASDVDAFLGGSFRWQSSQSSGFVDGDLGEQLEGYGVVDLRAGLFFGDRYAVELYARNVLDSDALTSGGNANAAFPFGGTAGVLRPRTIGATLTAEF